MVRPPPRDAPLAKPVVDTAALQTAPHVISSPHHVGQPTLALGPGNARGARGGRVASPPQPVPAPVPASGTPPSLPHAPVYAAPTGDTRRPAKPTFAGPCARSTTGTTSTAAVAKVELPTDGACGPPRLSPEGAGTPLPASVGVPQEISAQPRPPGARGPPRPAAAPVISAGPPAVMIAPPPLAAQRSGPAAGGAQANGGRGPPVVALQRPTVASVTAGAVPTAGAAGPGGGGGGSGAAATPASGEAAPASGAAAAAAGGRVCGSGGPALASGASPPIVPLQRPTCFARTPPAGAPAGVAPRPPELPLERPRLGGDAAASRALALDGSPDARWRGGPRYAPDGWIAERRRLVLGAQIGVDELNEPPVRTLEDVETWRAWAVEQALKLQDRTQVRRHLPDGTAEKMPLWETSPRDLGRAMGAGMRLYFDLLKLIAGLLLIGLLLAIPSLELNVSGGPDERRGSELRLTQESAAIGVRPFPGGMLYMTTVGPRAWCVTEHCRSVSLLTGFFDAAFIIFLLWAIHSFSQRIDGVALEVDMEVTSIRDYSVQLHGYPRHITPRQVKEHVEAVLAVRARTRLEGLGDRATTTRAGIWAHAYYSDFLSRRKFAVHEIVPLLDNYALLKAGVDKAPLEAEVAYLESRLQRLELVHASLSAGQPGHHMLQSQIGETRKRLRRRQRQLRACRDAISETIIADRESGGSTLSIIVSFHWEAARSEALHAFPADWLGRAAQQLGRAQVDSRFRASASARPSAIRAARLQEPADLILENFTFAGSAANVGRRLFSALIVLVLLFVAFLVFFWAQVEQQRRLGGAAESAAAISAYASLVAVATNMMLKQVIKRVVVLERRTLRSDVQLDTAFKLFVAQLVNMGLIVPLVSSAVPSWMPYRLCGSPEDECALDGVCCLIGPRGLLFRGEHTDVSAAWFGTVGSKILLTMIVQLFAMNLQPLARALRWWAWREISLRSDRVFTLEGMLKLYEGEQLDIAKRYGELMAYAGVVLIYAPGMPLLYVLGVACFVSAYWVDKWALLNVYAQPPPYDTKMAILASTIMPYFVLFHCAFALAAYTLTPGSAFSIAGVLALIDRRLPGATINEEAVLESARASDPFLLVDRVNSASTLAFFLLSMVLVCVGTVVVRVPKVCGRAYASAAMLWCAPSRVGTFLEGNPPLVDAIRGCDHPVLRVMEGGTVVSPADIERGADPWFLYLSPMTWLFKVLGIHSPRPAVTAEQFAAAKPVHIHLDEASGQQSTYAPDKNPFYRDAFLYDTSRAVGGLLRDADTVAGALSPDVKG